MLSRIDLMDVLTVEDAGDPETTQQLNVRGGATVRTVGRNVRALSPGGRMTTRSCRPTSSVPSASMMNGFHSGYRAKSVRIRQTCWGGAAISMSARNCFATCPA
jgi:hypothetical protein